MRLEELQTELSEIRTAMKALRTNGQEHTLNGNHSFKGISYSDLRRQEADVRAMIISLNMGSGAGTILPDFS